MSGRSMVSRALLLVLALVVLIETWVWDALAAAWGRIARFLPWRRIERAIKDFVNRAPAIFAVLLFGVPFLVMEGGSFFAVVLVALGHVVLGTTMYGLLKLVGVSLIALIYELTEEKLMSLSWFAWLHGKFERLHHWARSLFAPYIEAAKSLLRELKARALAWLAGSGLDFSAWRRRWRGFKDKGVARGAETE